MTMERGCVRKQSEGARFGRLWVALALATCLCAAGAMQGLSLQRAFAVELTDAQVQQRISEGSLGFFKSLGTAGEEAVAVLQNPAPEVAGCTNIGAEGDATSMYNLWQTVQYLDECNDLRALEGYDPRGGGKLESLLVDPRLMAIAEVQLNWSRDNNGHSGAYGVGENLAWGYYDPFDGWYYGEKEIYDKGSNGVTGHYLAIVNPGYKTTGFAVAVATQDDYGITITHGQTFSGPSSDSGLMTVAEFREALNEYLPVAYLPVALKTEWGESEYRRRAFYADGSPAVGWLGGGDEWYFADTDGVLQTGWVHDGTGWYWMDDYNVMTTGWQQVHGTWYYFDPAAGGRMATGWKSVGGSWYWFNPDSGAMATGWYKVNGEWNWSDSSGVWHANSWEKSGNGWWYSWADGTYPTSSWQLISGKWYHFDGSGYMQTGWLSLGGTWYYLNAGGDMATGWKSVGGTWYYLNAGGDMATGWKLLNGTWYYLNSGGDMATGWKNVGGTWYYLNGDGSMAANRWVGNYYVGASGAMATNQWIGNYHVNGSGLWDDTRKDAGADQPATTGYVGNSSTMKFHVSTCADVKKIDAANRVALSTRDAATSQGYSPCGHCNP